MTENTPLVPVFCSECRATELLVPEDQADEVFICDDHASHDADGYDRGPRTMNIRITEHTTTNDTYCVIDNLDTGESGEWFGDSESFIAEIADPQGMTVVELVWS